MRFLRHTTAALALVLVASGYSPGPTSAADERPDLQVELVGLPISNTERDVQVKVTNVSKWWADATKAKVETVSPGSANAIAVDVENLDPGQSTTLKYTLAVACDGHTVAAEVTPAKNYAGVAESNVGNNKVKKQVCPPKPAEFDPTVGALTTKGQTFSEAAAAAKAKPKPAPEDTGNANANLPEYLRPGKDRMITRGPSAAAPLRAEKQDGVFCGGISQPDGVLRVGFSRYDAQTCQSNTIFRTLLAFDLTDFAPIYGIHKLALGKATLSWGGVAGINPPGSYGYCVMYIHVPTADWDQGGGWGALETVDENAQGSREWNVTRQAQTWMADPVAARRGLVLTGPNEDLDASDDSRCLAFPENPKLQIVYTVLQ